MPTPAQEPPAPEQRTGRRRTYNRRLEDREVAPPYFDVFERVAVALEHIEELLRAREVRLPDAVKRSTADH